MKHQHNFKRLDEAEPSYPGFAPHTACFLPVAVAFLPVAGLGFLADDRTEYILILLTAAIAAASLPPSYFKVHGKIHVLLLFVTGISMVLLSDPLFGDDLAGRSAVVLAGAGFITAAHCVNRQLCRTCLKCSGTGNHS